MDNFQFRSHLLALSLTAPQPRLEWMRKAKKAKTLYITNHEIIILGIQSENQDLAILGPWKRLTQCCWTGGEQELVTIRKQSQCSCTFNWLNYWEVYSTLICDNIWITLSFFTPPPIQRKISYMISKHAPKNSFGGGGNLFPLCISDPLLPLMNKYGVL